MSFISICALLVIASFSLLMLSTREKELSMLICAVVYVIVLFIILLRAEGLLENVFSIASRLKIENMEVVLKVCGIATIAAISSTLCDLAGRKEIVELLNMIAGIEIFLLMLSPLKEIVEKFL